MSDPVIQQVQTYLQARKPLGIGYPLAADGVATDQLISILSYLQSSLSALVGHPVSVVSGKTVNPGAISIIEKALGDQKPMVGAVPTAETVAPTLDDEIKLPKETSAPVDGALKKWESFLSQSLPVVGKVYDGDLAVAAKKLESQISAKINKPMTGVIWNDQKKQFNTTPEDILAALTTIENHSKLAEKTAVLSRDDRFIRLSDIAREHDLEKNEK